MSNAHPNVVVLAGPNGAGKSTAAPSLLRGRLAVTEFVNADVIARGLSEFNPDAVAYQAGRVMLERLAELAQQRVSFAFETTLASRSFASKISEWMRNGYRFHLVFLWLPAAELAVARVADRVKMGGHNVPEETIRRRYRAGISNFFHLYQQVATTWRVYDNSLVEKRRWIAAGRGQSAIRVRDTATWQQIKKEHEHG
jgi:predicted ABC-type ATPase